MQISCGNAGCAIRRLKNVGWHHNNDAAKTLPQANAMVKSCCIFINCVNLMRYKALRTLDLCLEPFYGPRFKVAFAAC